MSRSINLSRQEGIMIHFWCFFVANSPSPGQYSVRSTTIIKSPLNGFHLMLRSMPVMGGWLLDTARTVTPLSLLSALLLWSIIRNSYSYLPVTQDGHLKTATSELRTLLNILPTGRIRVFIIFDAANMLIDDVNKDEDFRNWFKSLNSYVHKVHCLFILFLLCVCLHTLL